MVHEAHKNHIILWEEGDAYIHIDPKKLTTEFIARIKADSEDAMKWKKYRSVMKGLGYDV